MEFHLSIHLYSIQHKYPRFDYRSFLDDIFWSLFENECKSQSVIILNGHHGNVEALKKLHNYLMKHFAPNEGMES